MAAKEATQRRLTAVRIRNAGTKQFRAKYAGEWYIIPPNVDHIVPYDAMVLWCGDPTLVDIDKKRRFRTHEYARLCVKYGVYENADRMGENFPKLEIYNLADNTQIITVLDDPLGMNLTPETQTIAVNQRQADQLRLMQEQFEAMQAEMAMLRQAAGMAPAPVDEVDMRTEVGEDRPELPAMTTPTPDPTPDPRSELEPTETGGGRAVPDRPSTPKAGPRKVMANG
jgi:hypothetical protein